MKSMRFLITVATYCGAHVHIINTRIRSRTVMGIMTMVFSVVMQKLNNQAHQLIRSLTGRSVTVKPKITFATVSTGFLAMLTDGFIKL